MSFMIPFSDRTGGQLSKFTKINNVIIWDFEKAGFVVTGGYAHL